MESIAEVGGVVEVVIESDIMAVNLNQESFYIKKATQYRVALLIL